MIIDGTNLIAGRMASVVAKKALMGETVDIINCEEAVITGHPKNVIAKYVRKKNMGANTKGPFVSRNPDFFTKRIIRGMLPYKQPKGRAAFKRIRCYVGKPDKIKGKAVTIKEANIDKVPNLRYISVKEICKELGWQR